MAKTILITGGAKRVGKQISLFLAKEKYNIAITYNNSEKEALDLKNQLINFNIKCQIYKYDFNNLDHIEDLITKVFNDFGDLYVLVNNASIFEESLFTETSKLDFK